MNRMQAEMRAAELNAKAPTGVSFFAMSINKIAPSPWQVVRRNRDGSETVVDV